MKIYTGNMPPGCLTRSRVVKITDRPYMSLTVDHERKTLTNRNT